MRSGKAAPKSPLQGYRGKKVLVTGGLGFLGSNLAHRLAALGADVRLLDCLLPLHGGNRHNLEGIEKRVEWIQADIRDRAVVEAAVKDRDILFNIAAQTSHTDSMRNPRLDADINIHGQLNLLEAARLRRPDLRLVYCSTRAVYGSPGRGKVLESGPTQPLDVYSADKLAGENYHRIYSSVFGLNATILRVTNGYGPRAQMRQPSFGILNWFIRLAIDNAPIKIFGDGRQVRDYLYVDDIVDAFLMAGLRSDLRGETYNVASGKGVPLIEIVRKILRIAGKGTILHVPWPETNKRIDAGDFVADNRKIRRDAGWRATTALEDGLKSTIDFYEKNRRHYWG